MTELGYSLLYKLPFGWPDHVLTLTQTLERRVYRSQSCKYKRERPRQSPKTRLLSLQWEWRSCTEPFPTTLIKQEQKVVEHTGPGFLPPLLHSFWPNLPSRADPHISQGDISTWGSHATLLAVAASNWQFPQFLSALGSHSRKWGRWQGGKSVYRSLIPYPATLGSLSSLMSWACFPASPQNCSFCVNIRLKAAFLEAWLCYSNINCYWFIAIRRQIIAVSIDVK